MKITLSAVFIAAFAMFTSASAQYVILHEGDRNNNAFERYGVGAHYLKDTYMNNKASSITIPPGYYVNLCDEHPQRERGDRSCTSLPEGEYQIRALNKAVSYINVTCPEEPLGAALVRVYANAGQKGISIPYFNLRKETLSNSYPGYQPQVDGQNIPTNSKIMSSIWIKVGYKVTISRTSIVNLGPAPGGTPLQIVLKAGKHDFPPEFNDHVSWILIEKDGLPFTKPPKGPIVIHPLPKIKTKTN